MTFAILLAALIACSPSAPLRIASAPPPEFANVVKALDAAGLKYAIVGDEADTVLLDFETDRYRDLDGDASVRIMLEVFGTKGRPWVVARAFNLYSLFDCRHPDAARRVLMGANEKMGIWPSFDYDESDGTVTGRMGMPIPSDGMDAKLLEGMLLQIVGGADEIDPVLRRAMESGMVDWPEDDLGPERPMGWLETTDGEGNTTKVGWAVWAEKTAWASTLLSADEFLREFSSWNDEQRDSFGRLLASEFGGSIARSVFADWLRGAKYMEQHYPPVAVRFFAPEGTEVSVTVRCPGLALAAASSTRTVDAMGHIDVDPLLNWNDDALRAIERPTKVTFQLELACGDARTTTEAVVEVQPVGSTELGLPATIPVAMYVNEAHPWVRDVVAEAGRLRIADSLGATEQTDYASALRQVYAVWRALRARDLKYVSIHDAEARPDGSQAIREFHQSIRDEGANCADGTAAVASVLRAIGFDVHLFSLPGHVLLGVYLENSGCDRDWIFLETTALGEDAASPSQDYLDEFEKEVPDRFRGAEWNCFEAACESAFDQVTAAQRSGDLLVASIATLRQHGLRSIPVSKGDVGAIIPPPDQSAMEARRKQAQREVDDRHARMVAWLDALPNRDPVAYDDPEAVARDIERVGTDPDAMGRLLRSVDGDGAAQRCLRALAVLRDGIGPMNEAALAAFGGPSPTAGALLGLPASGARVELIPSDEQRTKIRVLDSDGNMVLFLLLRTEGDDHFIEGKFIEYAHEKLGTDALDIAFALKDDALHDAEGFRRIGRELAERVRRGEFKDRDAMLDELQRQVMGRFGRNSSAAAANGDSGIVDHEPGSGPPAAEGDTVEIHYSCRLADGTVVFDSRTGKGETRRRRAGASTKPAGFGRGLLGMRAGGRRTVTVPPDQGFGETGMPSLKIPPGATLVYEIEAISVGDDRPQR